MSQLHDLVGLALAAIVHITHFPGGFISHSRKAVPKLQRCAFVSGVFYNLRDFAVIDQPGDLAAEVELFPVRSNRPGAVAVQDDPLFSLADNVIQRPIVTGVDVDVGHALDRDPVEGGGPVGAAAAFEDLPAGFGVGFLHHLAPGDGPHQDAFINQGDILSGDAIIVIAEAAGAVDQGGIGAGGQFFRAITELAKIIQGDKRAAGEGQFIAQDTVQLEGVADGLMSSANT